MEFLLLLILPPLMAIALGCFLWIATADREIRSILAAVLVACVLLTWETLALHLCGLGENRSDLYNARCSGGTPDLPLLGIPVVLAIGLAAIRWRSPLWWLLGPAAFLAAAVVPWNLLSTA